MNSLEIAFSVVGSTLNYQRASHLDISATQRKIKIPALANTGMYVCKFALSFTFHPPMLINHKRSFKLYSGIRKKFTSWSPLRYF